MSEETTATIAKPIAVTQQVRSAGPDKTGAFWGTGRRKTAVARVRVKPGSGKVLINGHEVNKFFSEIIHRNEVALPLKVTKVEGNVDVFANVHGGGITGQAGAVKLGIARALKGYDGSLEPLLREHDLLTRDSRAVERKKYGQAGARRRYQFSKR